MIEITTDVIYPDSVASKVANASHGAVVTFLGTTRNTTADRKVLYLEYEAYRPMADNQLELIIREINLKWPGMKIAISHRLGQLDIGDISLIVAIGSPHRANAFSACSYAIDRIKQIVPIWKKEFFEGGEVWVGSQEDMSLKHSKDGPTTITIP